MPAVFLETVGRDGDLEDAIERDEAVLIVKVDEDDAPEVDEIDLPVAADDPVESHD